MVRIVAPPSHARASLPRAAALAASRPATIAAIRRGIETRPADRSAIARAIASRRASGSRRRSTSERERMSTGAMLGRGRFLLAPHDDRPDADARAEDLRAHHETAEDQQDPQKLAEEERPGHAETVQPTRHAGDESAERDEQRRGHA